MEPELVGFIARMESKNCLVNLYEHTNFISLKGKDMTSLLKLFGGLEVLPTGFRMQIETVPVNQVKELKKKLFLGKAQIEGISYSAGRGKG